MTQKWQQKKWHLTNLAEARIEQNKIKERSELWGTLQRTNPILLQFDC